MSRLAHNFAGEEYDGFDQSDHGSLGHLRPDVDSLLPSEDESDLLDVLPLRSLRRSKPVVDFSRLRSTAGTTDDFPSFPSHPRSSMSGSTLHSGLRSSIDSFPRKYPSLDFSPRIPPSVIASLTISDLHHNPHYCELRQKYDDLAGVLTAYLERDLGDSRVASSQTLVSARTQGKSNFDSDSCLHSLKSTSRIQ